MTAITKPVAAKKPAPKKPTAKKTPAKKTAKAPAVVAEKPFYPPAHKPLKYPADHEVRPFEMADIVILEELNTRAEINWAVVDEYAEKYERDRQIKAGERDPSMTGEYRMSPVIFASLNGTTLYIVDGRHRYEAVKKLGWTHIDGYMEHVHAMSEVTIRALKANRMHGLRRTNADKQRCLELALANFPTQSNRWIAEIAGVGEASVRNAKAAGTEESTAQFAQLTLAPEPLAAETSNGMTMRLENHNPAVKAEKLDKLNQLLQSGITSPSELMKETGLSKQTINTKKKAFAAGEEITPPAKVKEKEVKPKEDMDNHLAAVISAIKAHDKEITRQICFALMDFTPEVACYIPLVERALDESL